MRTLATKTLNAIEEQIKSDQGAAFRTFLGKVIPHMGDAFRGADDAFRSHMGASQIGTECGRAVWYNFRWATKKQHPGRLMRLFNRGHLEEARFIAMLLAIGCQVYQQDENGNQFRISDCGGHFGGSGDGVAIGIPDLPAGQPALTEFKTHSAASFKKLQEQGVRDSKFEHYVQMQTYMRKMGIAAALYLAVNKNDDDLYGEIVYLDTATADQFIDRAHKIIPLHVAPERINESPGWYKCKWCDHHPVCHTGKAPNVNCRTCHYSVPNTDDGKWYCVNDNTGRYGPLSKEVQLTGCDAYHPNDTFKQ